MPQRQVGSVTRWLPVAIGALTLVGASVGIAEARREAPPADRVGLCGFGPSCRALGCHADFGLGNSFLDWELTLDPPPSPLPPHYVPGTAYDLRLELYDSDPDQIASIWGFELGAVIRCPSPENGGTLTPKLPDRTTIVTDPTGLDYLAHACRSATEEPPVCGYRPDGSGPGTIGWPFTWTAPPRGSGRVELYMAFNAANWDGFENNDRISLATLFLDEEPCPPAIDDLRVRKAECDPGAPGVVHAELSWTPQGGGDAIVRAASPAELPQARWTWTDAGDACQPLDDGLVYYSVAERCDLGGEGFH